jgi:uncharacterized membrane protein
MPNLEALYVLLSKHLHYIYLLFAVPLVLFSVIKIPPFQNPDEPNHFARAEQVSRLELAPRFVYIKATTDTSQSPAYMQVPAGGFVVDKGVFQTANVFWPIAHHIGIKVKDADFDSVKNIQWGTGAALRNFANTAIYAPVGYVLPAIGIAAGKIIHLPVIKTFYLARMLNAMCAITLCFWALLLANQSKILLFTVLLFPMTLTLFASVSQDAVLISCVFLLLGLIDNIETTPGKNYTNRQKWLMVILISIITIAKPPYLPLALVFLFLKLDRKSKIISIALPCLLAAAWISISLPNYSIRMPETDLSFNSKLQWLYITAHPFKFIGLFFNFDKMRMLNCYTMFIGILGWLDTSFSHNYYRVAYFVSFLAFAGTLNFQFNDRLKTRSGLFLTAFITLLAVLTSQYLNFTAVGATMPGGMQGRYLTPVFPFLALALCLSSQNEQITRLKAMVFLLIMLFPLITAENMVHIINLRYYPQ